MSGIEPGWYDEAAPDLKERSEMPERSFVQVEPGFYLSKAQRNSLDREIAVSVKESLWELRRRPSVQVILQTNDGKLVGRTLIPGFKPPPDVIVWGIRFFALYEPLVYREVFAYFVGGGKVE